MVCMRHTTCTKCTLALKHHVSEPFIAGGRERWEASGAGGEDRPADRKRIDHSTTTMDNGLDCAAVREERAHTSVPCRNELAVEVHHVIGGERERAVLVMDRHEVGGLAVLKSMLIDDDAREGLLIGKHGVARGELRHERALGPRTGGTVEALPVRRLGRDGWIRDKTCVGVLTAEAWIIVVAGRGIRRKGGG